MYKDTRILIIGAGVSGLTTAICLKEKGFNVVIVAEKFSPELVSNVAGALWEWPPAACGKHGTPRSLERSKTWCMISYEKFKSLKTKYGSELTGIYLRNTTFYFHEILENLPEDLKKMNELAGKVDGFRRGLDIIPDIIDLTSQKGIKDAYRHMTPMVDTDVYMQWLFDKVKNLGCEIIQEKIELNLIEREQTLLDRFQCAAIVNCTGLGSIEIANDPSMYPLRGALIRVKDEKGLIEGAHCISHKETSNSEQDMVFIVPRGDRKTVILGGLVQMHQWGQSMSLNDPIIKRMYNGCLEFLPLLKSLPLDDKEPTRTGLRPFTKTNVCVEHVPATHLFYNYGHGGAGITLSWGCAQETVESIQSILQQEDKQIISANKFVDNQKQTVFLLNENALINSDLKCIRELGCNLILLCSRKGLSQLVPSQFEHFNYVRILEKYDFLHLLESFSKIINSFALDATKCRVITTDHNSVLLAAEIRETLDLAGDKPKNILPLVCKHNSYKQVQGTLYNISAIIFNGEITYFAPCKYFRSDDEFGCEKSTGYLITREEDPEYPILFEFLEEIINNLPIGYPPNRMINFDIALDTNNGEPTLIEIYAHLPIGLISQLFETYQSIALTEWHLKLQVGYLQKPVIKEKEHHRYSALCIFPKKEGLVTEINKPVFSSSIEVFWRIHPGQRITESKDLEDYGLAILLSNNHWEDLKKDFETACSQCYFDVRNSVKN